MTTLRLTEISSNFFIPNTELDVILMQHLVNENLTSINDIGLEKLKAIADAHSWLIEVEHYSNN